MKYRKKPVVVEAYKTDKEIIIHTLEGDMKASIGDYIITGVNGEKYPCKPDIFEKTYEAVTKTNYDRIKAMNIDEMADTLFAFKEECNKDCPIGKNRKYCYMLCDSASAIKEWLESEVSD